jgi:hypothetical protein
MNKDKKNIEKGNESFNLFIEKLSLIILDTVLEESKGMDNHNCIQTA